MSRKSFLALTAFVLIALQIAFITRPAPVTAQAGPQPAINPELIGMVVRDPWYEFGTNPAYPNEPNRVAQDRMGQILAEMGVRWVRVEFFADKNGGAEESIAHNSYFINEVAPRYGLKVMALLGFGLVREFDPRDQTDGLVVGTSTDPTYGGGVNSYMRTWLDRALLIARHFEGRIAAYEILNEQNRLPPVAERHGKPGFRGGEGIAPVLTARLHTKFYRCFKLNQCSNTSGDPAWRAGVSVIVGGLHPRGSDQILPGTTGPRSDRAYLVDVFTSEPFSSYLSANGIYPLDGIGYHPYPEEIRPALASAESEAARIGGRLDEVRADLRTISTAAGAIPFWITEIGYNTAYAGQSSTGQAAFLRAIFTTMAARSDVVRVFWFKYEDFPPAQGSNAQRWGVVHIPFTESPSCLGGACYAPDGEPAYRRAAYFTLRELAGLPVQRLWLPSVSSQ